MLAHEDMGLCDHFWFCSDLLQAAIAREVGGNISSDPPIRLYVTAPAVPSQPARPITDVANQSTAL